MLLNGTDVARLGVHQLAYVRLGTAELQRDRKFMVDLFGLQAASSGLDQVLFRSDARHHTLALMPEEGDAIGIEVANLDHVAEKLKQSCRPVRDATMQECASRHVGRALITTDASGNTIELVAAPAYSGKRFFPSRDAGVTGLSSIALRSINVADDTAFWTQVLGAEVSDWVGEITYLRFDNAHHRIVLYPSTRNGVFYHAYGVTDLNALMRNKFILADHQVEIVQGPGRETASGDIFLRVRGPGGLIVAFVVKADEAIGYPRQARRFEPTSDALCDWGSRCESVPELAIGSQF